jgi:glycerol-3-phosphate cytidylyltransferase-like family protein
MSTIVIMPGGFHPFHAGHAALYNSARRAFPDADVYVAATNDTSTRPFPFAIKEKLAKLAGVEPGHFVQVKSPFQAKEITANFNPEVDQVIFVRSEKDADKPPQAGGVKKNGEPAYLQPLLSAKKIEPFSRHAYMAYLPTVEFGPGMTSATEIRAAWPQLNEKRKTALVMSLYPRTQGNAALANNVVKMLDTAIGTEVAENQGFAATLENKNKCPPATQDITLNLKNRQKAIDEYGYGPLNPDMPNVKFWMAKVDEWNLDSVEEAQQSLCGNCAAFDQRQATLDCIAKGIDADDPADAEGTIDAGDLGYCKFLKFKCASRRTCDAWVTGGPLIDKQDMAEMTGQNFVGGMTASYQQRENQPIDEDYIEEKWSQKYKRSINCNNPQGFSQRAHCAGRKK